MTKLDAGEEALGSKRWAEARAERLRSSIEQTAISLNIGFSPSGVVRLATLVSERIGERDRAAGPEQEAAEAELIAFFDRLLAMLARETDPGRALSLDDQAIDRALLSLQRIAESEPKMASEPPTELPYLKTRDDPRAAERERREQDWRAVFEGIERSTEKSETTATRPTRGGGYGVEQTARMDEVFGDDDRHELFSPPPPWASSEPADAPPAPGEPPPPPPPLPVGEPDPPRTAYARLDAPEVAVVGSEIAVVVGLAPTPDAGIAGGPLQRPASSVGPYTLSIHLVADGFRLADGETLRRELRVTAAEPYPTATFHLTPEPQQVPVRARTLQAFYEVDGQTIGLAVRPLAVLLSPGLAAGVVVPPAAPGVDLNLPADLAAADLEVRILLDESKPGRLLWTFTSPHAGIGLPDQEISTAIGLDTKSFARQVVDKVNLKEGQVGIYRRLAGIGQTIADNLPADFWRLLRAVAARLTSPPSVLIYSQEPYVPWELALLKDPPLDPAAPPFLSAQANVGRWVLPQNGRGAGSRQLPRQPPPMEIAVRSVAVVSGVYDNTPGWTRLREAEGEADDLAASLGAAKVEADSQAVDRCLQGHPAADLLHFACHGTYDPNSSQDGLMLTDGQVLDPLDVKGYVLAANPFVFLNACQVGAGNQILGDYAGMAAAFLDAGASGVIAPLWSIKDTLAREIAKAFYAATEKGALPAAALREARRGFLEKNAPVSATYLAYQFFGHPSLKLDFAGH